jgi:hypothetical protein
MIETMTLKAVQKLLKEKGIEQLPNELMGDYVARGLGISDAQAQTFLKAIDEGKTIEQASLEAGVGPESPGHATLLEWGRSIGAALGELRARMT